MAYAAQIVAFLVAIASQFFEAVKKDVSGRPAWRHGIPVLTRSGLVIFILLVLSSFAALLTLWVDHNEAQERQDILVKSLNALRAQNEELSKQDQESFTRNLKELEDLRKREQELGVATAQKINQSASTLLAGVQKQLAEARYVVVAVLLNGKRMRPVDFERLGEAKDGYDELKGLLCADQNELSSLELRINLQLAPHMDLVLSRFVNDNGCYVENKIELVDNGGEKRELSAAIPPRMYGSNTFLIGGRLRKLELEEAGFSRSLLAGPFGEGTTATLTLVRSRGSQHDASYTADLMEARLPKSIAVLVRAWYALPEEPQMRKNKSGKFYVQRADFERAWYLQRGPMYVFGGGESAEYYFTQ